MFCPNAEWGKRRGKEDRGTGYYISSLDVWMSVVMMNQAMKVIAPAVISLAANICEYE